MWIIGGYTNVGKTASALNIAAELIRNKKKVAYFSFEMGQIDILARLIGIMSGESGLSILKGYGKNEDKINEVMEEIRKVIFLFILLNLKFLNCFFQC